MRVLLIHPEDSPRRGPWSEQRWDLIVDLGRSSEFSANSWAARAQCPVLRSDLFRRGVEDIKHVRDLFLTGRGRMIDEEGIDWWDLTSLLIVPEAETVLVLRRVAAEIGSGADLWATRMDGATILLSIMLDQSVQNFSDDRFARVIGRATHYANLVRRFSALQIGEIFFDKYDSGYKWRSRLALKRRPSDRPVVLVPSAYGNVSRMAAAYARLLPNMAFLMVATRQSATQFELPPNMELRNLAAYAKLDLPDRETASILQRWNELESKLRTMPEFDVLSRAGIFNSFPAWLQDGLCVRNAWRKVIAHEPVCGVLCGDDSNRYTRIPVLLAARRRIPTVDFHHGAFDGRYLLKELPCDLYLAKNEMERDYLLRVCGLPDGKVVVGAPSPMKMQDREKSEPAGKNSAIFFSEPYEIAGLRAEEVYRELLPLLCRLAREHSRRVIIKLHPFESHTERSRMIEALLPPEDRALITILSGPLSAQLLQQAWFGITVESTTVMDCLLQRVPCFLCGWVKFSSHGYVEQYAHFWVGDNLRDVNEISDIPRRIAKFENQPPSLQSLWRTVEPETLRQYLTIALPLVTDARCAS